MRYSPAMLTKSSKMVARDHCIACSSSNLQELDGGKFSDEPLQSFINADPWGENPLQYLADERWSLVKCGTCGQKFHRHILSPEWNEIRFTQWMSGDAIRQFEAQHGSGSHALSHVEHVLRLQKLGVKRVLDFGCGFGHFLEMCRLWGLDAVGVDRSSERRNGAGIQIAHELSQVDGQFDAVTMFEVLEHLDDPLTMLTTLAARLNKGGVLVLETPDCSGNSSIKSLKDYRALHPLDHINAFTPETLEAIARKAGFIKIRRPAAIVTTNPKVAAKQYGKALLKKDSTQQYYRLSN